MTYSNWTLDPFHHKAYSTSYKAKDDQQLFLKIYCLRVSSFEYYVNSFSTGRTLIKKWRWMYSIRIYRRLF